jgi:hypothetical protein
VKLVPLGEPVEPVLVPMVEKVEQEEPEVE